MMGHPRHTAAEERFARSQTLWLLRDDWASVARGPSFERWIAALDNPPRARSCRRRRRCRARMFGKCWRSGRRAVGLLGRDFIRHRHTNRLSSAARRRAFFT